MVDLEKWCDVAGYEGALKVSESGRVYSLRSNKLLKQSPTGAGYFRVCVYSKDGKKENLRINRLVASAFLFPPCNDLKNQCAKQGHGKVLVRHKDDNKSNNHHRNLCWGTQQDNADDYVRSGKSAEVAMTIDRLKGKRKKRLSQGEIAEIKKSHFENSSLFGKSALAKKYAVTHKTLVKALYS